MSKTGALSLATPQSSSTASVSGVEKLDVWTDTSAGDGTSAILAQPARAETGAFPTEISPSGLAFQDGARVVSVPGGYVAVWYADGLDGSLLGVFGQRLDGSGKRVGSMFRVNSTTEHDQRDPAIAAAPGGKTIVVWSSYGQDGDLGGIYGQLFDPQGNPVGGELRINSVTAGHQARPQLAFLPDGSFVVGWTTEALGADPGAISIRLFDSYGSPLTSEVRIAGNSLFHPDLVDLEPDARGGFSLRWLLRDRTRTTVATYLQQLTAQGAPLGAPVVLP